MPENNTTTQSGVEVPIIPVIEEPKNSKKAFNNIQKQFDDAIGKQIDIINKKVLDISKNLNLAFIKVGKNKYARALLNLDNKGNLLKYNIATNRNGGLRLYTKSQATRLTNQTNLTSLRNEEKVIEQEAKDRQRREKERQKQEKALVKKQEQEEKLRLQQEKARERVQLKQQQQELKKQTSIQSIQTNANTRIQAIRDWANIIGENLSPLERSHIELNAMKQELSALQKQFNDLRQAGVTDLSAIENQAKSLSEQIQKTSERIKQEEKRGAFGRLISTFVRVGFYRVAKGGLIGAEQAMSQGIENLAKFDSSFNQTMSNITSQFTILTNSIGLMVAPFVELFEPVIKFVTEIIVNLANTISYLTASIKGQNTYLKVNTEYWKDFNEQQNLLSFDKFEALGEQPNIDDMFIEEDIANAPAQGWITSLEIIASLLTTISLLGIGSKFSKFAKSLKEFSKGTFSTFITKVGGLAALIAGIYLTIDSIVSIINWDEETTGLQKVLDIMRLIFGVIAGIAGVIAIIKAGTLIGGIAAAIGIVTALAGIATTVAAKRYADGGMVDTGSLFIAGESGAELVTTMSSGQTGVTNIAQFQQAVVNGLNEWWSTARYDLPETATFTLDGAKIARSKRFIGELNRKNTGLNLR